MPGQVRIVGGRRVVTGRGAPKKTQQEVWTSYPQPKNAKQEKHNQFCAIYHQIKNAVADDQLRAAEDAFRKNKNLKPIKALRDSFLGDATTRTCTKRLFQKSGAVTRAGVESLTEAAPAVPKEAAPTDLQSWLQFRAPQSKALSNTPITPEQALDRLKIK